MYLSKLVTIDIFSAYDFESVRSAENCIFGPKYLVKIEILTVLLSTV